MAAQGISQNNLILRLIDSIWIHYLSPGLSSTPLFVWAVFTDIGTLFKVLA